MIKQKEIDNIILQFGDDLLNENNVYSKQTFKRLQSDVNIIFGQIDSKVDIINPHNDTDNKRRMYYSSYLGSLIINMLFRVGLFEHDKKTYLTNMEEFYDIYHDEIDSIGVKH